MGKSKKQETRRRVRRVVPDLTQAEDLARFPAENPYPVLRLGKDGAIVYANSASRPLVKAWGSRVGAKAPSPWIRRVRKALRTGTPADAEETFRNRVFLFTVVPVKDRGYVNLYARDITERKQAEDSVLRAKEEWERTFDAVPDLVAILDKDHRIVRMNKAMADRLGVAPEQCIGLKCHKGVHGTNKPPACCPHVLTIADGKEHVAEVHEPRLGGDFLVSTTPIRDAQGRPAGAVHIARDITERKKAEQVVRESREDLNRAQAVAHTGSWRLDMRKDELTWSDESYRIFGVPRGTPMTYETFLASVHPDDREYVDLKWSAALRGELYDIEHRILVAGEVKWVRERAEIEFDKAGNLLGGFGTVQDITARREAEQALRESEERYRHLFSGMTEGFALNEIVCDEKGVPCDYRFLEVNPAFTTLTRLKRRDVVGRLVSDVLPDIEPVWIETFGRVALTGKPAHMENYSGRLKRWYEVFAYRPAPGQFATLFTDITARREAEQVLREAKEKLEARVEERTAELKRAVESMGAERQRFNSVLNEIPPYVVLLTRDYRVAFANRVFRERFGEDDGRRCYEFLFQRTEPCENCETYKVLKTMTPHRWEWTGPDGRNYDIYDFPFTETDGATLILEMGIDISERKRAERALREQSRELDAFFEHSLTPLVFLDPKFNFLRVNEAYAKACSRPVSDFAGHNHFELYPHAENQAIFQRVVDTKTPYLAMAKPFLFPDHPEWGATYWNWTLTPVFDDAGEVEFLVFGLQDVTERERARQELTQSEARYRSLVLASAQVVWTTAPDGQVVVDMPSWRAYTGQTADEMKGRGWGDALHPDDRERTKAVWKRAVETRSNYETEYRLRRRDGAYRLVVARGVPVLEKDGSVREWVGTCTDVTEERAAEREIEKQSKALQLSEARFRAIMEEASEGVLVTDARGAILDANSSFCRTLGYEKAELTGRNVAEFLPEQDLAARPLPFAELRAGKTVSAERRMRRKDGVILDIEGTGKMLLDGRLLLILRDVTPQRQAREMLRAYQSRLKSMATEMSLVEERQRREIARDLHDRIGQALAVSKMRLGALKTGVKDVRTLEALAEVFDLISRTLDDTRSLTFELCPPILYDLGLEPAIEYLVEEFGRQTGIAARFSTDGGPKPLDDSVRGILFRSVRELLHNVRKHAGARHVRVSVRLVDKSVEIAVEDDGAGFDASLMRVGVHPGGGFGLFGIREQIGYLGGYFNIESSPGKGTRAVLTAALRKDSATSSGE